MRLGLMLVAVVACTPRGATPSPRPAATQARTRAACPVFAGAEAPDVAVPHTDLPADPEWDGATREPVEPHFDLARAFGVADWRQACLERGQPRGGDAEELLRYLMAWCGLPRNGAAATRDAVFALAGTRTHRLAAAVQADAIALLGELDAGDAVAWLTAQHLGQLDELAVRFHALGRDGDARVVLAAIADREERATPAVHCRRMQREASLGLRTAGGADLVALAKIEPACAALAAVLDCPAAAGSWAPVPPVCDAHCAAEAAWDDMLHCHSTDPMLRIRVMNASARRHWPAIAGTSAGWKELASAVAQTSDREGLELAHYALENARAVEAIEACERDGSR